MGYAETLQPLLRNKLVHAVTVGSIILTPAVLLEADGPRITAAHANRQADDNELRAAASARYLRNRIDIDRANRDLARAPIPVETTVRNADQAAQRHQVNLSHEAARRTARQREAARERLQAQRERRQQAEAESTISVAPGSAREIGRQLVLATWHSEAQFTCLDNLWQRESGWDVHASNSSSGAYGIPQALPGDKMAAYGGDWQSSATTQIRWGLHYIEGSYGTPCNAWQHSEAEGWY